MIGRIIETNSKTNSAVNARISQARQAWGKKKHTLIKDGKIDRKFEITLFDSIVGNTL